MLKLLDISEICYIIQRLNSYNSLTIKLAGKFLEQFTGQIIKAIEVPESWKQTFHLKDSTSSPQI